MSENITHTAVTDDCVRLALHSPRICRPLKLCLGKHLDSVRLGGVTRSGGTHMPGLLTKFRKVWPNRRPGDLLEEKLAFVLGWHTHRAADLQMKPIFETADKDCPLFPTDCSIYHDVFLFREVYDSGRREPYLPTTLEMRMQSSPAAGAFRIGPADDAFRSVWGQQVLGLQSFVDGSPRLERLVQTRQEIRADLRRYAETLSDPDPDKTRRFIVEINFYDRKDPIVRLARSLQHGRPDKKIELGEALAAAAAQSQYARALQMGYGYLRAASDYFQGRIELDVYKDRLGRGQQGV